MVTQGDNERRYGGRTADERRADRRRRLLDTALELFGTEGYAAVGIERICSTAGVTARHFYEEFGSREGLLRALYDEIVGHGEQAVARALAEAPLDPVARARAGLDAFVHTLLDDPRKARVSCLEIVGVSDALEAHRREVLRRYAGLVELQANQFGLQGRRLPGGYSALALALVGGTNELVTEWLHDQVSGEAPLPVDQLVNELVYLFIGIARAGELPGMAELSPD